MESTKYEKRWVLEIGQKKENLRISEERSPPGGGKKALEKNRRSCATERKTQRGYQKNRP